MAALFSVGVAPKHSPRLSIKKVNPSLYITALSLEPFRIELTSQHNAGKQCLAMWNTAARYRAQLHFPQ